MSTSSFQDRKTWIGAGVVAAIILVAACWFMLISPELSAADSLHSQASDQRAENLTLENNVTELKSKSSHLSSYITALKQAMASLPSDSGMSAFTRQVNGLAASSHTSITAITVGAIAPALPATPATSTSTSSTSTSTDSSASTPTTTTSTAAVPTGTGAVAGTLYSIPLTVTSQGSLAAQTKFLAGLRSAGPRYGLVTSVQFAPAAGAAEASIDGSDTMTVQVTVFSQPQSADELAQLHKLLSGDIGS